MPLSLFIHSVLNICKPRSNTCLDRDRVVDVATDGQEGRELVETFAYDLLLLDEMLPKLNEIRLCQQL